MSATAVYAYGLQSRILDYKLGTSFEPSINTRIGDRMLLSHYVPASIKELVKYHPRTTFSTHQSNSMEKSVAKRNKWR